MNKIHGIVFDLDGTLLNTSFDLTNSFNKMLKIYGYPQLSEEEFVALTGSGIDKLIRDTMSSDLQDSHLEEAKSMYEQIYSTEYNKYTEAYPKIDKLLEELVRMDVQIAVLSNKVDHLTKALIEAHFPEITFVDILGVKDSQDRKPNPDQLISVIKKMNLTVHEVLMVGDTENDIAVARNVGIKSVAVSWGFRNQETLYELAPDYIVEDPLDILELIN